jgi:hypothetical protein
LVNAADARQKAHLGLGKAKTCQACGTAGRSKYRTISVATQLICTAECPDVIGGMESSCDVVKKFSAKSVGDAQYYAQEKCVDMGSY